MLRKYFTIIISLATITQSFSQQKQQVDITDILDLMVSIDSVKLKFENVGVTLDGLDMYYLNAIDSSDYHSAIFKYLRDEYPDKLLFGAKQIYISSQVVFENCDFSNLFLDSFYFSKGLQFIGCSFDYLEIKNSHLELLFILQSEANHFRTINSTLSSIHIDGFSTNTTSSFLTSQIDFIRINQLTGRGLSFESNGIGIFSGQGLNVDELRFSKNLANNASDSLVNVSIQGICENLQFVQNTWPKSNVRLEVNSSDISFIDNKVNILELTEETVTGSLRLMANSYNSGIDIRSNLTESSLRINWNEIKNKLGLSIQADTASQRRIYPPSSDLVLLNDDRYLEMSRLLLQLSRHYKETGQMDEANEAYIVWKDMESKRLLKDYGANGGFENYVKWRLNQLLKLYSKYGTSPALSIVMSVYIILFFSVFYFFFPAEWDTTSKRKLRSSFKELMEKNDSGHLRPLGFFFIALMVSIINALTLSLNSFVTLGFGKIPTSGIARYVCVVQGFLGWFLLSIFTVTLINQVMI